MLVRLCGQALFWLCEDRRCFLATYLYGPQDERTVRLRVFRDIVVNQSALGRRVVQFYYCMSPLLISVCKVSYKYKKIKAGSKKRLYGKCMKFIAQAKKIKSGKRLSTSVKKVKCRVCPYVSSCVKSRA